MTYDKESPDESPLVQEIVEDEPEILLYAFAAET